MAGKKIIGRMDIVQLVGLSLLLIALPLGSWYYLQTGLDYRLQAFQELQDIAPLPAFEMENFDDSIVRFERFEDQLVVGHFFNERNEAAFAENLAKLHEQFDERSDIYFLAFRNEGATSAAAARQLLKETGTLDEDQVFMPAAEEATLRRMAERIQLPLEENGASLMDNSLLFFADSAMVRGFYDLQKPEDMRRLIKHITLNLHPTEEADIIYDPETEK